MSGSLAACKPFVYGGLAACLAEFATFPIDTAKTRLQLQGQATDRRQVRCILLKKIAIKSTPGLVRIENLPWSCSLLGWISPRLSGHLEIVANNPYNYCKQLSQRCTNVNLWPCPCWGSPSVVNCRVGLHPDVQMELEIFASYIFTYIQQIHLNKISSKVNLWPCPVWAHPVLGLAEWDLTQMSRWV